MSLKNLDSKGRLRSKTVGFRVSPEEDEQLETAVRLSGLTKQDYIIRRLQEREIVVVGNPRVFKMLRNQFEAVYEELRRIEMVSPENDELFGVVRFIAEIMKGLNKDEA
jgi:uncharacterized protein (DUF1778 family)